MGPKKTEHEDLCESITKDSTGSSPYSHLELPTPSSIKSSVPKDAVFTNFTQTPYVNGSKKIMFFQKVVVECKTAQKSESVCPSSSVLAQGSGRVPAPLPMVPWYRGTSTVLTRMED